jgi:hypothetical protein
MSDDLSCGVTIARRLFPVALVLTLLTAASARAQAPIETAMVSNMAGAPPGVLGQAERAVADQVALDVRPHWHVPEVRFGTVGTLRVVVETPRDIGNDCLPGAEACHDVGVVYVAWDGYADDLSSDLSHEVIEALADPGPVWNSKREICDPVNNDYYTVDGRLVQDFMLRDGHDYIGEVILQRYPRRSIQHVRRHGAHSGTAAGAA